MAFAVIWCFELFWIQSITLLNAQSGGPQFDFWAPKIRLALDLCFVTAICSLMRVRVLAVIAIASLLLNAPLAAYTNYSSRPLSMLTILSTWREGLGMAPFLLAWVPLKTGSILIAAFAVKFGLLFSARGLRIPLRVRGSLGAAAVSAYLALFAITLYLDPLSAILTRRGVARLGIIRGYSGPWLAELYYLTDDRLLKYAIERSQLTSDLLSPVEAAIPMHQKLVVIQIESLDYNVLGYRHHGKEVTPFLNQLRDHSLFYRTHCYHYVGSADADFTMLVGGAPAQNVLNYNLSGFPYENTLPQFLGQYGFKTSAFHGNVGSFYNRRHAFDQMGFERVFFREDLEKVGTFELDGLGLRDRDVMTFSSLLLRQATGPTCHFLITLTSHTPYQFLKPHERLFNFNPRDPVERYFNHAHYVDTCLRDYINSLGKGVTVVLYADHASEVGNADFTNSKKAIGEFIPVMIYDTDRNLARLQQTRDSDVCRDGSLKMLDISSYLRQQIKNSFKPDGSHSTSSQSTRSNEPGADADRGKP